ncbi:MAG: hypothetical protein LBS60_00465 [Deltaproteobacteria bacterium]|jgi:nickel transport protein|nr:hypothetical protein [Deltaproteobacteria bacterium]
MTRNYVFKALALLMGLGAILALAPNEALAHGVYIFGWEEGDQICSDSYFTRSDKVQGGTVRILGPDGSVLAEGRSSDAGLACFPRPQVPGDLQLVVEAGEGHRAEFTLRASELSPLSAAPAPSAAPASPTASPASEPASASASEPSEPLNASLDNVRSIVREELKTQLSPIIRTLAESRAGGEGPPTFREIFGGLGWVAGVFGVAFFFSGRKRKSA